MNAMQHAQRDQPCIAIINTSEETLQLLQELMMDAGFASVSAYVPEFKRGERDIGAFFREYQPQAVLYDIAIPYIENWKFFQEQVLARDLLPNDITSSSTNTSRHRPHKQRGRPSRRSSPDTTNRR